MSIAETTASTGTRAYLYESGKIEARMRWKRALGLRSCGRPSNFDSSIRCAALGSRMSSHLRTSSHALSFRKLCICTMTSMLSSGVSFPFLIKAL